MYVSAGIMPVRACTVTHDCGLTDDGVSTFFLANHYPDSEAGPEAAA